MLLQQLVLKQQRCAFLYDVSSRKTFYYVNTVKSVLIWRTKQKTFYDVITAPSVLTWSHQRETLDNAVQVQFVLMAFQRMKDFSDVITAHVLSTWANRGKFLLTSLGHNLRLIWTEMNEWGKIYMIVEDMQL